MEIFKIRKKYCTDNKVQLMLSNAPHQIICSSDGYTFLRENDLIIHPYITDTERFIMPYSDTPISEGHVNHLFEYDRLYVKVTSDRRMGRGYSMSIGCFDFTFLYFTKLKAGDALCAEIPISYFKPTINQKTQYFNKNALEEYLYRLKDEKAKIIFDGQFGIKYARHKNEEIFIKREYIDISDEGIIKEYNSQKEDENLPLFDEERRKRLLAERPWEIHNIDEIKEEVTLTYHGMFSTRYPTLVTIKDKNEIEVMDFKISFCNKHCFKVETKKIPISFGARDLITAAFNMDEISYTSEPDFD